jgi:hypothetical protein
MALMLAGSVGWPIAAHYRAKARLADYKYQLQARGEKLTTAQLTPLYSAEGSAGASALLAPAGRLQMAAFSLTNPPSTMRVIAPGRALVGWRHEPLPTSESTNVWPGLTLLIGQNQAALDEVHAVLGSSKLAFNLDYSQGFNLLLPHLQTLKTVSQWLSAETCLALHEGRTNDAWESLRALTALVEQPQDEPLIISALVRMAIGAIAVSATWEALQSPDLGEAQLQELQRAWASVDVSSQMEAAMAMERALGEKTFAEGRESYAGIASASFYGGGTGASGLAELAQIGKDMLDDPKKGFGNLTRRYPGYWAWKCWQSYDDELANAQTSQAALAAIRSAREQKALGPALAGFEQATEQIQKAHPSAGVWLGYSLARDGGISNFLKRAAKFETLRSLVLGAIALKRYHLKHGSYPAQLSGLAPEFMPEPPLDPMDGQPLRYRLNADGSFVLYSVGDDGVDNGGDPSPLPGESDFKRWLQAHDVVWPSPASAEEASAYFAHLAAERQRQLLPLSDDAFRRRYGINNPPTPATNAVK